ARCPCARLHWRMVARHAAQIIRGPPSTSESAGRVGSLPTPGAFPARARRDSPSSETPCVANSGCSYNSDSWQAGDANIRQLAKQCSEYYVRSTNSEAVADRLLNVFVRRNLLCAHSAVPLLFPVTSVDC